MRLTAFIAALALASAAEAAVTFGTPRDFPDIGLKMPVFAGAIGEPLELPRATAYLVGSGSEYRLEDRYDGVDLWTSLCVRGCWRDQSGNRLWVSRFVGKVPSDVSETSTRAEFSKSLAPLGPREKPFLAEALALVAPSEPGELEKPRRSQRQNFEELLRVTSSDARVVMYAFRPRVPGKSRAADWYSVSLEVAPGEDLDAAEQAFDKNFLDAVAALPAPERGRDGKGGAEEPSEAALLEDAVRRSVVNYSEWHFTRGDGVALRDDLEPHQAVELQRAVTNLLPRMRKAFAAAVPSPLADADRTAMVRVFDRRADYIACVGTEYAWTSAVWAPMRRELVASLPEAGVGALFTTLCHESFHQYLAYAGAMITSSPWFNEGHAELFEHTHFNLDGEVVFDTDPQAVAVVRANCQQLAELIPSLLKMDYEEFYAGAEEMRAAKYSLAWSIAYFLQVGADRVRFQPFKTLRADYMAALVRTRSALAATRAVLPDEKERELAEEWLKFWSKM